MLRQIFEISIIHKPSRGSREVPQKFEPDRLIRFDVYFKTNKQTPKQSIYIDYQLSETVYNSLKQAFFIKINIMFKKCYIFKNKLYNLGFC